MTQPETAATPAPAVSSGGMKPGRLSYVLITPARNEVAFIEKTLQSVVAQSVMPLRWVIVSDGSTDGTDQLVEKYSVLHPWIELVRTPERKERNFAGKVQAFNAGYARVQDVKYDCIGSIDADLSFDSDFFSFLMQKLQEDPKLGLVGTRWLENNESYDYRFVSLEHVSGLCQFFRRACFEQIGGYTPVRGGGIDVLAVLNARMKGWKTRTFTEKHSVHHKPMGSSKGDGGVKAKFRYGEKDYSLGGHPLWEVFRCVYQMRYKPYVLSGMAMLAGYTWSMIRRLPRPISPELMALRRKEEMARLKAFFGRLLRLHGGDRHAPAETHCLLDE
jgi:poly-beta-1,6-N-acetyl-D-glucosamine synthase